MYNSFAVYQSNIVAMILISITISSILKNISLQRFSDILFFALSLSIFFGAGFEILGFLFDFRTFPGANICNRVANSILYAFNPVIGFLWALYAHYKIYTDTKRLIKAAKILIIPTVLVVILSVINLFTDVFFTITEDNIYQRTDLFFIAVVLMLFYLFYVTIIVLLQRKNLAKSLFISLLLFMVLPLIGMLLQIFIYGLSLTCLSIALSAVIVYNYVQNDYTNIDWLTRVYNRKHFDIHLKSQCKRKRDNLLVGFMMDLDGFKNINDTYGHIEGDYALQTCVKLLHLSLGAHRYVARYAGDEFVALFDVASENEAKMIISAIHDKFEQYNQNSKKDYRLSLSIGYALYQGTEQQEATDFLHEMDRAMYSQKRHARF